MISKEKVFGTTLMISAIVIISTYVSWLLGFQGFLLIGTITMPVWISHIVCASIFYITFAMWAGVSTNEYSIKLLAISSPSILMYIFGVFNPSGLIFSSTIFPLLYICLLGYIYKDFKNTLRRGIQFSIIVSIYQFIMLAIKTTIGFNQLDLSIFEFLALSVDSLIFQGILFCYGGELLHHVRLSCRNIWSKFNKNSRTWECLSISGANDCSEQSNELNEIRKEFNSLTKWERNLTILFYLGIQIVQCIIILLVCHFIGNVFLQGLVILSSFILHGFILRERLHSKSIIVCTIFSSILFLVAAKLTPSFFLFQLLPVVIGLLISYSSYKITILKNRKTFQKWYNTVVDLTQGKYSNVGNHKEVALAKGLKEQDLELVGYTYNISDGFSKLIAKLSPWNNGEYVRKNDLSE